MLRALIALTLMGLLIQPALAAPAAGSVRARKAQPIESDNSARPRRDPDCLDQLGGQSAASGLRGEAADVRAGANAAAAAISATGQAVDAIPYEPPIIASVEPGSQRPAFSAPRDPPLDWRGDRSTSGDPDAAEQPEDPCQG